MSVQFAFRHMESSEAVTDLVTKKIEKLHRLVDYPVEFHVAFSATKLEQTVEISCHAEHHNLTAKATTSDLYESIDSAVHKIENQLKKEREKRKGHQAAHKVSRNGEHLAADIPATLPHAGKVYKG